MTRVHRFIFLFIAVSVFVSTASAQSMINMNVSFENVTNEKIRNSFLKVMSRYESLHDYHITLKQKKIKSSTMQAQPVIKLSSLFGKIKTFQVKLAVFVRDSEKIKVEDLPEDVLTGWFAHELGHLVDYQPFTGWQMIGYGLKYVFSQNFKRQAEYRADYVAIKNEFHEEIIASKRYILENDFLGEDYKSKIKKYYLSVEQVELCLDGEIPLMPASSE